MVIIDMRENRKKNRPLLLACVIFLLVAMAILGWCALDWPLAIISGAVAIAARPVRRLLTKREEEETCENENF